jgi:hypothetical protein
MTLETAQLLCTAHHALGGHAPYRPTHANHPTAVWVRASAQHYGWAYLHFKALAEEYERRYGRVHKSWATCENRLKFLPPDIPHDRWVDPPLCMPEEYQCGDYVESYKRYYAAKMADWAERKIA